jgi:N6-adenosine-specific RNA methylase IME4
MVWEKTYGVSNGMALYGFRWNGEFILVGYKTKPELWMKEIRNEFVELKHGLIPVVFSAQNIRHSEKPEKFYRSIEHLGEKRIDIFARKKRKGWDAWGDEICPASNENNVLLNFFEKEE